MKSKMLNTKLASLNKHVHESAAMVRRLNGEILFWNRLAEKQYGWSREQAQGNVSHHLFETIFPCPLDEINQALLARGYWEGELIHTMSDGSRVKVKSRWDLQASGAGAQPQVVEVNQIKELVTPATAHVREQWVSMTSRLWAQKYFLILPVLLVLLGLWCAFEFTDHYHTPPIKL